MSLTYAIYVNSGESDSGTYIQGSNVSIIEVTNSDQQYYQTGFIELFDVARIHDIGNTAWIFINGIDQFKGYISRKEQTIEHGKKFTRYQLVGETYDLWRYSTDDSALYSGTTSYITSSLISTYCEDTITFPDYNPDIGYIVTSPINLTNITVGDAVARLTELDGYSFFVKNGELHYYSKSESYNYFTITESDLVGIDPVEESDEDIVNECLIIGGTGYSDITNVASTAPSSEIILRQNANYGRLVAQQFEAEDSTLSAVDLFLDRTKGSYQPSELDFEIWENSEKVVFIDTFDNWNYLNSGTNSYNMRISGGYLCLVAGVPLLFGETAGTSINQDEHAIRGSWFVMPNTGYATTIKAHLAIGGDVPTVAAAIYASGTSGEMVGTLVASSAGQLCVHDATNTFTLKTNPLLIKDNIYYLLLWSNGASVLMMYYNGETDKGILKDLSYGTWPNEITGESKTNYRYGIWCEYEKPTQSGQIESYCYSGQYVNEISGYDCRYIKLSLDSTTSPNRIYISGTHDSGGAWNSLENNTWLDLSHEDHSVKVRYKMSSNGIYTPKIGTATLMITDSESAIEQVLYSDTFDNYTFLSGASISNTRLDNGNLQLSGSTVLTAYYMSNATFYDTPTKPWINETNFYDKNESTYAYGLNEHYYQTLIDVWWSSAKDVAAWWLKGDVYGGATSYVNMWDMYYSGLATNGFKLVDTAERIWTSPETYTPGPHQGNQIKSVWFDIKKMRFTYYGWSELSNADYKAYESKYYTFNRCRWTGNIKTSGISTTYNVSFLKPSLIGDELSRVTLSGSCDGGAHWTKLYNNTKTAVSTPGNKTILWFRLKPWLVSGSTYPNTPKINSCTLTAYALKGGGIPKSGTKLEWSTDVQITYDDVIYPPSSTGWQKYTSPKLSLIEGNKYWFVLEHMSGGSSGGDKKYWTYYYDPKDTYDGRIAYSWNNGYKWSTNAIDPTDVPAGNMRFKLGWTTGDIQATATNQDSIDLYGRHFKKITDSSINTREQAQARADLEVSGMTSIPKQGRFVITGRNSMSTDYMFSANLTNFGINERFDIKSYTQRINKNGFTTEIQYGKHRFDIAKKIAQLENETGI